LSVCFFSLIVPNGFGYDCGAALGANLAEDLTALSLEIRAGKASPGRKPFKPVLVLFKCRKFQGSSKVAMNYSRCWALF